MPSVVIGKLENDEPENVYDWYRRREFEKKHRKAVSYLLADLNRTLTWAHELPIATLQKA
jgi:hypothetical protein